ncbi:MAG TPA: metallophosphoesterase [Kofleriaceae bacterium]|nr:metallophosphoesterase [Kofleriaceae bacterium]
MRRAITLVLVAAACRGGSKAPSDGATAGGELVVAMQPDASATLPVDFRFAVVGDTRPPNMDDVNGYPTGVITAIWGDVQAVHPDFAISTGDYMFATSSTPPTSSTVDKQLDLYLGARAQYTNAVFAAMGNHECTGATASNCGPGSADGVTFNMAEYQKRMLAPLGITLPYFTIPFAASDGSWTAKLVFVAANAWNPTQSAWLDGALAQPTTYTFVIRHESDDTTETPGVAPSETLIAKYPFTLKIVGHTHTYEHDAANHEIIVGNGGAPLTSGTNYGYVIVERLDSAVIQVTAYDYQTNAVHQQFRINADGTAAP